LLGQANLGAVDSLNQPDADAASANASNVEALTDELGASDHSGVENSTHSGVENSAEDAVKGSSMLEFYQLRQELLISTLILTLLIFGPVWYYYSLNTALNYLLGACTGVVYLRLLARNVEQLGKSKDSVGKTQLAVFIGVMIVATQVNQLHILPVFLGFLTFKLAILVYTLRTTLKTP
jgi:ATP synthase protein I